MKRYFAALTAAAGLLLLAADGTRAQASPLPPRLGEEVKIPLSPAASEEAALLLRSGFLNPYLPPQGREPLTRQTLAESIARLIRAVQQNPATFDTPSEEHWRLLSTVVPVAMELTPELTPLGIEPFAFYRTVRLMAVPTDHWAYGAVDSLRTSTISIKIDTGPFRNLWMSRLAFADTTIRLMRDISVIAPEKRYHLPRLIREFEKEIRQLGGDVAALKAQAETYRYGNPFPDVPAGHWAAPAVETVRQAGILRGFPGGTFHALVK